MRTRAATRLALGMTLSLTCSCVASADGDAVVANRPSSTMSHLAMDSDVGDILNHRAFDGFARLILPSDDRPYDEGMPLSAIGSLLPYHSNVKPAEVTRALNRMIHDVERGRAVFHRFYTKDQIREQPAMASTGLFFFRGRPGAPFAIVCPGGGFQYVASLHEGFPLAAELSAQGYSVFVLKYRVDDGGAVATQDLAAAISYVFRNADALGVSTTGYSLWGSSAGARMAASIGSHGVARHGGDQLPKPSVVVMAYTAHADHSSDEPSTFVVVGEEDVISPPSSMEARVRALRRLGAAVEYRKYENVGHGFGLGTGTTAEGWVRDAIRFWAQATRINPEQSR